MRHPPYHLRPNKAVDRLLLVRLLEGLDGWLPLDQMSYYGLGGPFLDEFRIVANAFPRMNMVSITSNEQTHLRQRFHKLSSNISLVHQPIHGYLDDFREGEPCVFWLDYVNLDPDRLSEFERLLSLVGERSIVKLTVRAQMHDAPVSEVPLEEPVERVTPEEFRAVYGRWLRDEITPESLRLVNIPVVVEGMVQVAGERAMRSDPARVFQVLQSHCYNDGTQMLSVTGVVCLETDKEAIVSGLEGQKGVSFNWGNPQRIDVPELSLKERLHLEECLPVDGGDVGPLQESLNYRIDSSENGSRRKLEQFAQYYRDYPLFGKMSV